MLPPDPKPETEKKPPAPPPDETPEGWHPLEQMRDAVHAVEDRTYYLLGRVRLPAASVLPAAGAVVGLYAGLAAGVFANLIGIMNGMALGLPRLWAKGYGRHHAWAAVIDALEHARWHSEFAIVGLPLVAVALYLSRRIPEGGERTVAKRRFKILAILTVLALGMYYPLLALSAVNAAVGRTYDLIEAFQALPVWAILFAPALGGLVVGRMLRDYPHVHGHGVPEVVMAVKTQNGLHARGGLLKLIASSITIGTGGSAGREGPIVYGGAAFGSAVGRTLGFSQKELAVLLACGAGAGIAASFNAPIAGAIFAVEIILREFELTVFSPIILASVTATIVSRGVMGSASMINHMEYSLVSGSEIFAYGALGLLLGCLGFAFIELLHGTEAFFSGKVKGQMSTWLGKRPYAFRAMTGGLICGALALVSPTVWGTGHEFVNLAAVGKLTVGFLAVAAILKLVGTCVTIGSGGSGGTFFPATVIGAMAGGALGVVVHHF
ncbi:MAG: chloride channel protein, partial [Myxococcaceae bacterium]